MANGINWGLLQTQNPADAIMRGVEMGSQMGESAQRSAMNREKMQAWRDDRAQAQILADEAAQAKADQLLKYNEAMRNWKLDKNPDTQMALKMAMPEDHRKILDEHIANTTKEEVEQRRNMIGPIYHMMKNGDVKGAKAKSLEIAQNMQADNPELASMASGFAESIEKSPAAALGWLEDSFAFADIEGWKMLTAGKKDLAETETKRKQNEKTELEIQKTRALMENPPPPEMDDRTVTVYNQSQDRFKEVNDAQGVLIQLADLFDIKDAKGNKIPVDLGGKVSNWIRSGKKALNGLSGDEKARAEARIINQFQALRLVESLRRKPPGAMSEKELTALLSTAPSLDSGAEAILDWVGDLSKAYRRASASETIRATYYSTLNSHLPPKEGKTIEVEGQKIRIRPNESPEQLIARIGPRRLLSYSPTYVHMFGGDGKDGQGGGGGDSSIQLRPNQRRKPQVGGNRNSNVPSWYTGKRPNYMDKY